MRFQVSTRRTGLLRIVRVDVLETDEFSEAYRREWTRRGARLHDEADGFQVQGTVIPRLDWDDRDPRPYQARMLLRADTLTATLIAHEATHAALHIYSIDSYRDNSRATAHVNIGNEIIPHMIGDLFSAIALRVNAEPDAQLRVGVGPSYA